MSLLSDVQSAVATFTSMVANLVTQTNYLISIITGPPTGAQSVVDVGPRTLKTLARVELEIQASNAFNPLGVWNSGTTYAELDAVSSGGMPTQVSNRPFTRVAHGASGSTCYWSPSRHSPPKG